MDPENDRPLAETSSRSTALRVGVALLVVALLVAAGFGFVQYRRTQDLEETLAEREAAEEQEATPSPTPTNPLGDLFGEGDFEDLLGELGGLLGGGTAGGLECLGASSPLGGGDLFGDSGSEQQQSPQQLVRRIASQVERVRAMRFRSEVEAEFLDDAQFEARVSELFLEDYTPALAQQEQRVLVALGAVPAGSDLLELRQEAIEGQVVGFYVPETGELVVRAGGEIGALDKVTLAHELEHALADQRLDLPVESETNPAEADGELAALSLVEGDATLTMQQYSVRFLTMQDQFGMLADSGSALEAQQQLESMPYYLQQELTFPYMDGLNFVCELFTQGGWDAVNDAYSDPPDATDQVLFPERYNQSSPIDPSDVRVPPGGWREEITTTFGAAELKWLFEAPGDNVDASLPDPLEAVRAWGGGELTLFSQGDRSAVGIALVQSEGESGLCESVSAWYSAAFPEADAQNFSGDEVLVSEGDAQDAVVRCSGRNVRVGIAPSVRTARALTR